MKSELQSLPSFEERLKKTAEKLKDLSEPGIIIRAAENFYRMLVLGDNYRTNYQFNGNLIFIKASDSFVQLGEDYGLNKVST